MTIAAAHHRSPSLLRQYLALTKPRVMTLVVFTGLCGMLAAPGHIHPVLGFTAILCIALGAGAAAGGAPLEVAAGSAAAGAACSCG